MDLGKNAGSIIGNAIVESDRQSLWKWGVLSIQIGLGALFIYAGVTKLLDPLRFEASILGYQIIPLWLVGPIRTVMPWIEIILGLSLVMGWRPQLTSGALATLLIIFTILVVFAIANGWIVDCGCFGSPHPADGWKVVQNGVMLGITILFNRYPQLVRPYQEWKLWLVRDKKP
ncbi:hypothetical protein EB093_07210 [bacterium]|nr:hypothetical protein [bacterium]